MTRGQNGVDALLPRGYADKPYRVMPLGVDSERFFPDAAAGSQVRLQLGWTDDGPPVIGFLGRFIEEKGIRTLDRRPRARAVAVAGNVRWRRAA